MANAANERAQSLVRQLVDLPDVRLAYPADANEVFLRAPGKLIDHLETKGFQFYRYGADVIRLVTAFSTTEDSIGALVSALRG
jgi:threonine aldolase